MQQAARSLAGGVGKLGKTLIVAQVALSLVLLLGAGLLVRTFQQLRSVDPGFVKENLLEISLNPKPDGYQNADMNSYRKQLVAGISRLPGVHSASFSEDFFPSARGYRDAVSAVSASEEPGGKVMASDVSVWPGFFATLGIGVVRGRDLDESDDEKHPRVAVVSASLAKSLFPHTDAIGQRIRFGVMPEYQDVEIVGLASDARLFDLRDSAARVIYFPAPQHPDWLKWGTVFVRTQEAPEAAAKAVGHEIESLGREYPVRTESASQVVSQALVEERVTAILAGFFAGLGLLLASIGLYGLMSYVVTHRTREIGIRVALGAQRQNIIRIVLRETAVLSLLGIAMGVPCGLASSRLISGMLFGVSSNDFTNILTACPLLLAMALFAGYVPARRASCIDPIVALRAE